MKDLRNSVGRLYLVASNLFLPLDLVASLGSCQEEKCDQICLPRIGARRECACALGYVKIGDTRCVASKLSVCKNNILHQ